MNINQVIHYPQDEMNTVLLPVTIGCSYNRCAFCSMYKGIEFSQVPLSNIEIQLKHGKIYTEKVFLTGADPMVIGFDKMKQLLEMIHDYLPYCACVASYGSIKSISKYSIDELSTLHDKGLRLLYIGFETGKDKVLQLMKKGHTIDEALKEAKKLNEAKLPFNTIIIYGIAGRGKSVHNGIASAKMINQFITNKVITMNLTVFHGTELSNMVERGEFIPSSRAERLIEIKTLLENLKAKTQTIFDTSHPTNIVNIKGTLPYDKKRLIDEVNKHIT